MLLDVHILKSKNAKDYKFNDAIKNRLTSL